MGPIKPSEMKAKLFFVCLSLIFSQSGCVFCLAENFSEEYVILWLRPIESHWHNKTADFTISTQLLRDF